MKKALCLMVLVAALVAFGASAALAQATVVKDFGCQIIPEDSGLPILLTTSVKTIEVDTPSGNVNFTCHFVYDKDAYPIDKAIKNKGFNCNTYMGLTNNSMAVTSPGGTVLLRCQIKP